MSLYDFQQKLKSGIYAQWVRGAHNVIATSPTGSGKTVLMGNILLEHDAPAVAIAHRQELVSQISLGLNRENVPHGIIAPKAIISQIIALHHDTHGYSRYAYSAPVRVAGVDTLIRRDANDDRWFHRVTLVVQDEAHHLLSENKWGQAQLMFPNARGLGLTAHAIRADGEGLGRGQGGLADALVVGPSCRDLIDRGFLTDYRLLAPPTDIDVSGVAIGSTGDFSAPQLRKAVHESKTIVGDVVQHYLKHAGGKLGITFAVDIEAAKEFAAAYNKAGVSAEVITAKTPMSVRGKLMRMFRDRQLLQLVSVDVLSEGVDVPAIEVVSIARHTASFQVYAQQTGRALRTMVAPEIGKLWHTFTDAQRVAHVAASKKPKAILLDHVQNYSRHGLPDARQQYSLMRRERGARGKSDVIPLRVCGECIQPYERFLLACPYCGTEPVPSGRGTPELVDGDLIELHPDVLAALRGEVARIDGPARIPTGADGPVQGAIMKNHLNRSVAQRDLRHVMAVWGGYQKHLGRSDREQQKRFFHAFGVDVLTACTLGTSDAAALQERVQDALQLANIVEAA